MRLNFRDSNVKIVISTSVMIVFSLVLFSLAYADLTPNLNYAGDRGSAANFTSVLNAVGAETTVCATQGIAVRQQYYNNFGFGIPASATLNGLKVTLLASTSTGSETWSLYLRKTETGSSSSVRTASITNNNACGATQGTYTFGGTTDLWGMTLTPTDVNAADFGVLISLPAVGAATRRINTIVMEINYTLPTSTVTVTVTSTTTLTSTVTANTTITYNSTVTSTVTSTTTLTNTVNSTRTINSTTTLTTTITSTFSTTNTFNTTSTLTTTITTVITTETCTSTVQTPIFYDGFESGNYSKWNTTSSGNLGSIAINSVNPINGTYDSKIVIGNNINGFGWSEGTANNTQYNAHPSFWMLFFDSINPLVHNSGSETHFLEIRNATMDIIEMGYFHDAYGNHELEIELNNPELGAIILRSAPIMLSSNSKQKIELGFLRNNTDGYLKAFINGSLVIDYHPAKNNYSAYNITAFRVGIMENSGGQKNFNATIDNVYVGRYKLGSTCYPISTLTTTSTLSTTTTITAATCIAISGGVCAYIPASGTNYDIYFVAAMVVIVLGVIVLVSRKRRSWLN